MPLVPSVFQVDSWEGIMGKPWSTDDTLEITYFPSGSQMYNTCTFCYCLNIKGILYYTWPLINTRARILTEFCPSPQLEAWVRIGVIWQGVEPPSFWMLFSRTFPWVLGQWLSPSSCFQWMSRVLSSWRCLSGPDQLWIRLKTPFWVFKICNNCSILCKLGWHFLLLPRCIFLCSFV